MKRAAQKRRRKAAGRFRKQVAIVTGASRGIGLAVAEALAAEGAIVVLVGRDPRALQAAEHRVASYGGRGLTVCADVRKPESARFVFRVVRERYGRVDILFNNAGIAHRITPIAKLPLETWREVLDTNLTALLIWTQALLPLMKRGATVVNNLSVSARKVYAGSAAYTASKFGALGFTDTLREEVRGRGIRVISLMPGPVDTALWDTLWPTAPRKRMIAAATVARVLVEALAQPAETTVEEIVVAPSAGPL
ncbi:MAG TPA: SDR family NAD(P)-dependent oxidoreductase [Terriglobales bacterium]|nr:SDR family NAD(P)-dependent oxidoreductase [Terriglobales bacterium]